MATTAVSGPNALSITEAAELIRTRQLSPVELTRAVLDRIDAVDGRVRAYVTVLREPALAEARQAEQEIVDGAYRGPLHGIPIAVKDLFDTAGILSTSSSKVRAGHVPSRDAAAVERLRAAGAVLVGKTVTHEFAYGVISSPTRNPWNLEHIPGGSSGGSGAALAADECLGALGTDTGGSIRIPASVNGVAGIKPTYGRVSKYGVASLAWSLDHVGPMGKSVGDLAIMLGLLAGRDPRDSSTARAPVDDYLARLHAGVQGLRLGLPTNYFFEECNPEVARAVRTAAQVFRDLGAEVQELTIADLALAPAAEFAICVPEASAYHQAALRRQADDYGEDVRLLLEAGELYLATHYLKAQRVRTVIRAGVRRAFDGLDGMLTPTLPQPAARHDQAGFPLPSGAEEPVINAYVRTCCPFNLTGLPALSIPCGFTEQGLPIGLQIAGRPFDEAMVLRIGQAYESATDWHRRSPPL
ncbi:MAG: Asp-tRNA(Asn)/Glu-tRNA(Gln) amidotransferase GatCAB subunit A [Chloroflexi bacterium]|nr:Asp-tRNA(Asn)/Glu-tRNA(Gln) amidotransferase GatCAB subunit A [Chloroflexota bacterium]